MHRFRSKDHTTPKPQEDIEAVMNEVSTEIGVDLKTKSINKDPKSLAKQIEEAIKKRT